MKSNSKKRRSSKPPKSTKKSNDPGNIQKIIHNLPEEQQEQIAQQIITGFSISKTSIGPLPPPEDFEKYEKVLFGAADRIMSMAEREQQIHAKGQNAALANDKKRINFATLLGFGLLAIAGIAVWNGNSIIALPLGLIGAVSAMFRTWLNFREKSKQ